MKRRVFNKATYVIRIGGQFALQPGRGAIVPEEYAKDPALDRYIKAGILEGDLLSEEKPKAAPKPKAEPKKEEKPKEVEKPAEEEKPKEEEKPAEEPKQEDKPKTTRKKRGSKAKAE